MFIRNAKKLIPDLKAFVSGVLAGAILIAGVGVAKSNTGPAVTSQVRFVLAGREIQPSDRPGYYFNGKAYVPAALGYNGTTYVPLRFVAESLGLKVEWDQATHSIILGEPVVSTPVKPGLSQEVPFKVISLTDAPPEVQELVGRSLDIECSQSLSVGDTTYLLVTRGEMRTGGYAVDIEGVADNGNEIVVTVEYKNPAPGAIVTQVITYPYVLAAIPRAEKPLRFEGAGDELIPQLHGLEHLDTAAEGTPNVRLLKPVASDAGITVRGIARVFEAALNWEVRDQGGAGRILRQGYVQAAAGAPNWGYFSFHLPSEYVRENYFLRVFWLSPKDGAASDIYEVALDAYARRK